MSGVNFFAGAQVRPTARGGNNITGPDTVGGRAFGPGYAYAGAPSDAATLAPNDGFGVSFWAATGSLVALAAFYHSGNPRQKEMIVTAAVVSLGVQVAWYLPKLWAHRHIRTDDSGVTSVLAEAIEMA